KAGEAGRGQVARAGATAVPDIGGDVVVIAAARKERAAGIARRQVEAERVTIEGFGRPRVADLQVNMADTDAVGHSGESAVTGGNEAVQIEPFGRHGNLAVTPGPGGMWPVDIDLDAVALWIGEIERLADQMVGG